MQKGQADDGSSARYNFAINIDLVPIAEVAEEDALCVRYMYGVHLERNKIKNVMLASILLLSLDQVMRGACQCNAQRGIWHKIYQPHAKPIYAWFNNKFRTRLHCKTCCRAAVSKSHVQPGQGDIPAPQSACK